MLRTPAEHTTETKEDAKFDWVTSSHRKNLTSTVDYYTPVSLFRERSPEETEKCTSVIKKKLNLVSGKIASFTTLVALRRI